MRMWGYYVWHTFVNSIKRIFRKEFVAVFVIIILVAGVFGAGAGFTSYFFLPEEETESAFTEGTEGTDKDATADSSDMAGDGTGSDGAEDTETLFQWDFFGISFEMDDDGNSDYEDSDEEIIEMTPEEARQAKALAEMVIALVFLLLLLIGVKGGSKDGAQIFSMADVNFLFPSPRKPQTVLLFRMTFMMAAQLCGMAYLLIQVPGLATELELSGPEAFLMVLGIVIALIYMKLASLLSYMLMTTIPKLKKWMWPFLIGVAAGAVVVTYVVYIMNNRDFLRMCESLYGSAWSRWFPVVGWMKGLFLCAVDGKDVLAVTYAFLLVAGVAVLVCLIWRFDADFYEDALVGAQKLSEVQEIADNGGLEQGKTRSKRLKRNVPMRGLGASAFFWKEWANRRRFAFLGLFTKTMVVYMAVSLICCVATAALKEQGFLLAGILLFVVLFFRTYGNPIATETSRNWLRMVPESPYAKVFFSMLSGSVSTAIDLLPTVLIGLLVSGTHPVVMLLWYLDLIVLDFMLSALGLMLEALFPVNETNVIRGLIQFFIKLCMGVLLFVVLLVGSLLVSVGFGLAVTLLFAAALGITCFLFYPMFLHDGTK